MMKDQRLINVIIEHGSMYHDKVCCNDHNRLYVDCLSYQELRDLITKYDYDYYLEDNDK